jgi:hypothetical protein
MLNDPLILQGPLSPGSPLQNGNLKQMKILMNDWEIVRLFVCPEFESDPHVC